MQSVVDGLVQTLLSALISERRELDKSVGLHSPKRMYYLCNDDVHFELFLTTMCMRELDIQDGL